MLSRIFSEPLMSVSNKHNYKTFSESPPAFPPYFFNQLERQATIFDKQNQNLCMKRAPTYCPTFTPREIKQQFVPEGRGFHTKNHPRPKLPGGTLGDTLDTSITKISLWQPFTVQIEILISDTLSDHQQLIWQCHVYRRFQFEIRMYLSAAPRQTHLVLYIYR